MSHFAQATEKKEASINVIKIEKMRTIHQPPEIIHTLDDWHDDAHDILLELEITLLSFASTRCRHASITGSIHRSKRLLLVIEPDGDESPDHGEDVGHQQDPEWWS